jgi:hypothetical protein
MQDSSQGREGPASWAATLAGMVFFVIAGMDLILGEIPHAWGVPSWPTDLRYVFFLGMFVFPVILLGAGWVQGFPRWSYPCGGFVLLFSSYMMHVATPGLRIFNYTFGRNDLWGWRAWVPFLIVTAIVLLITRSLRPLSNLFTHIWDDWTLLTFGMFGCMPLLIGLGFDEVDRLYSFYFMVILTLLMSGTAMVYLRGARLWHRALALLVGTVLTIAIVAIAPTIYWLENGWVSVGGVVIGAVVVVALMFSPALIGLLRHSVQLRRAGC